MRCKKIQFYNFRNIENCAVKFDSNIIYLIGKNAQGKTNFLEALYLLSYGASFRTRIISDLKKHNTTEFSVSAVYNDEHRVDHTTRFRWSGKGKEIFINDDKIMDRKALINLFPCVIFSYSDYVLVNGSSKLKRTYFDQIQCFQSIDYIDMTRKYEQILKNRNNALKNKQTKLLEFYNIQLSQIGIQIMETRKKIITECEELATAIFRDISRSQDTLSFEYIPAWKNCSSATDIIKELENNLALDLLHGYTCRGVHRDKIIYTINNKNASDFASTGQTRVISLILRIIQARIIADYTQKSPLLLLDDVLLELDNDKRNSVLSLLPPRSQIFFTFMENIDKSIIKDNKKCQRYFVDEGKISGGIAAASHAKETASDE